MPSFVSRPLHIFGRFGDCCAVSRLDNNRRGYLSRDVRLSIPLLVVNPKYDMRKVGFETIKRMQKFGMQNAVSHVVGPWCFVCISRFLLVCALRTKGFFALVPLVFVFLVLLLSHQGSCRRGALNGLAQPACIYFLYGVWRDFPFCRPVLPHVPFRSTKQLLLDLSALMEVPSLRVFCLESTQTLDEDPEGMFQVSNIKLKSKHILIHILIPHPAVHRDRVRCRLSDLLFRSCTHSEWLRFTRGLFFSSMRLLWGTIDHAFCPCV